MNPLTSALEASFDGMAPELLEIYKDLHRHPELSMQERRTAGIAADYIEKLGYEVTRGVGVTGVVGLLRNGDGPTVMLRADMDALPMAENTGLPYASTVTATDADGQQRRRRAFLRPRHARDLAAGRGARAGGVARRVAGHGDGGVPARRGNGRRRAAHGRDWGTRRLPASGRHPRPARDGGRGGHRELPPGVILSAGDSLKVQLFGRGSHGSQPQTSIDPVIMAAATTLRLQTIVSREIAPSSSAVLTIGSLQAGTKENIIPDDATIKLNMRTFNEDVRDYMLKAIRRICCAECEASKAPQAAGVHDDQQLSADRERPRCHAQRVVDAFHAQFGDDASREPSRHAASEDFSVFGRTWKVPYVFWFVGGTDPEVYAKAKEREASTGFRATTRRGSRR